VTLSDTAYFDIAWSSDALPIIRVLEVSGTPLIAAAAGGSPDCGPSPPTRTGNLAARHACRILRPKPDQRWTSFREVTGDVYLGDGLNGGIRGFEWTGMATTFSHSVADTPDIYLADAARLLTIGRNGQLRHRGQPGESGVSAFVVEGDGPCQPEALERLRALA
jgi:hypothetical protein